MSQGECYPSECRKFWVASATFVANCPEGMAGSSVTVTKQFKSYTSLEHAEVVARQCAKREAMTALVCHYESTQCFTPPCPGQVAVCATSTSLISQIDADTKAIVLARDAAQAVCDNLATWFSSQEFTAYCAAETCGNPVTRIAVFTSSISQAHAGAQALMLAQAAAQAALVCTPHGVDQSLAYRADDFEGATASADVNLFMPCAAALFFTVPDSGLHTAADFESGLIEYSEGEVSTFSFFNP